MACRISAVPSLRARIRNCNETNRPLLGSVQLAGGVIRAVRMARSGGAPPWASSASCSMRARARLISPDRVRKISNSRASLDPKW